MATSCTQAVGTGGMAPFPIGIAVCSSSVTFQAGRCQQHGSVCRRLCPSSLLMLLCDTELGGLRVSPRPCPPSSPQEQGPGKAKFPSYFPTTQNDFTKAGGKILLTSPPGCCCYQPTFPGRAPVQPSDTSSVQAAPLAEAHTPKLPRGELLGSS